MGKITGEGDKVFYNYTPEHRKLAYGEIQTQVKFLQGKVLTVIDASYSDGRQLQAVKDLINRVFSEQLTWISQICYPELPMQSREQVKESGVDVDKVEREAEIVTPRDN